MYIPQRQLENLKRLISPNKVVVVYGPRRCAAIHGEKRKLSNKGFPVLSEIIFRNVGGVITIESYRQRPDTVKIMTLDIPIEICYVSLQTCISRNIYHSVRCVR